MKRLLMGFVMVFFSLSSAAMELNQLDDLLKSSNLSMQQLQSTGHKVLLGEVTGAGFVVPADRLEFLILQNKLIEKRDIEPQGGSFQSNLADLAGFQVKGQFLPISDVKGFVIK